MLSSGLSAITPASHWPSSCLSRSSPEPPIVFTQELTPRQHHKPHRASPPVHRMTYAPTPPPRVLRHNSTATSQPLRQSRSHASLLAGLFTLARLAVKYQSVPSRPTVPHSRSDAANNATFAPRLHIALRTSAIPHHHPATNLRLVVPSVELHLRAASLPRHSNRSLTYALSLVFSTSHSRNGGLYRPHPAVFPSTGPTVSPRGQPRRRGRVPFCSHTSTPTTRWKKQTPIVVSYHRIGKRSLRKARNKLQHILNGNTTQSSPQTWQHQGEPAPAQSSPQPAPAHHNHGRSATYAPPGWARRTVRACWNPHVAALIDEHPTIYADTCQAFEELSRVCMPRNIEMASACRRQMVTDQVQARTGIPTKHLTTYLKWVTGGWHLHLTPKEIGDVRESLQDESAQMWLDWAHEASPNFSNTTLLHGLSSITHTSAQPEMVSLPLHSQGRSQVVLPTIVPYQSPRFANSMRAHLPTQSREPPPPPSSRWSVEHDAHNSDMSGRVPLDISAVPPPPGLTQSRSAAADAAVSGLNVRPPLTSQNLQCIVSTLNLPALVNPSWREWLLHTSELPTRPSPQGRIALLQIQGDSRWYVVAAVPSGASPLWIISWMDKLHPVGQFSRPPSDLWRTRLVLPAICPKPEDTGYLALGISMSLAELNCSAWELTLTHFCFNDACATLYHRLAATRRLCTVHTAFSSLTFSHAVYSYFGYTPNLQRSLNSQYKQG